MATNRKGLAQGASNGNSASGRAAAPRGPQATANRTFSGTKTAASYVPPVATKPVDANTKGKSGLSSLGDNLRNQTGR
jgi:hypothetical protein